MSTPDISRAMINALLPDGDIWNPEKDGDFDRFLEGLSLCIEDARSYLEQLGFFRDPYNISEEMLQDLEKEYGIVTKTNVSVETRRMQLAAKIYERGGTGSPDDLKNALINAGFNVYVHPNDPAVDPAIFLDQSFQVTIGDPLNAYIGDPGAYFGRFGGYLLVNGPIIVTGGDEKEYNIPTDPDAWPFIFFLGGIAIRNVSGQLIEIFRAEIPAERKSEFESIILQYKPIFTWAGIIVTYV